MKPESAPMFLTPFRAELVRESPVLWKLQEPLVFRSVILGRNVEVPSGFETDLASVPRWPVVFWLTGDCAKRPAVIHDYLYTEDIPDVDKLKADCIFLEAMDAEEMAGWRTRLMYLGVRLGGRGRFAEAVRNVESHGG